MPFLYEHQKNAVDRMFDGCILNGGVGSGKSRTALYYYFTQFGGKIDDDVYVKMKDPIDLYVITTAKKRDDKEWEREMVPFLLSKDPEATPYTMKTVVDSWNNIKKYANVTDAFFIFDEDRVTGNGAWVKAYLKIARRNRWVLLTATPGDTWSDYIPVFIANGFYRNRTEFAREHIVYSRFTDYPKIDRYLNTGRLVRLRNKLLVDMDYRKRTVRHDIDVWCDYDVDRYKQAAKTRWNPFTDEPIRNASELCYVWRKIVNGSPNRLAKLLDIFEKHDRLIIFYNFDYELEAMKDLFENYMSGIPEGKFKMAEWNGHNHQPIPESESWAYLVQYNAGAEGWNSIHTDTIVFYSQTYSYKMLEQARGRIDRLNTPYTDLYYFHMKSKSGIDVAISRALSNKKKFNEGKFVNGDRNRHSVRNPRLADHIYCDKALQMSKDNKRRTNGQG